MLFYDKEEKIQVRLKVKCVINHKNDTDKIETLKKNNIFKCIKWCKKNKIPYNNISLNT